MPSHSALKIQTQDLVWLHYNEASRCLAAICKICTMPYLINQHLVLSHLRTPHPFSFESQGCSRLYRSPTQDSSPLPQLKLPDAVWVKSRWLSHSHQGSINSSSHWMHQLFLPISKDNLEKESCPAKSKFLCSFHSKFSHFWRPKSGHLSPQILKTWALGT